MKKNPESLNLMLVSHAQKLAKKKEKRQYLKIMSEKVLKVKQTEYEFLGLRI